MDTTEKRIKMCEKAGEIQKEWKLGEGDWVAMNGGNYTVECFNWNDADAWTGEELIDDKQAVWLPRQDQLQEMVDYPCQELIVECVNWLQAQMKFPKNAEPIAPNFSSMEILWLAAIMDWKFNKKWDDEREEWIRKEQP